MRRIPSLIPAGLIVLFVGASTGHGRGWLAPEDRLDDATFWRVVAEFSEPSGVFPSDNLVSNEMTYPSLMPEIAKRASERSAYVGVGPEQNFSYIAALRPRVAFIVDIRRQNVVLHLLYKALFEMSATRADFLSKLFSRESPPKLSTDAPVEALLDAFTNAPRSRAAFDTHRAEVRELLSETRGFGLGPDDLAALDHVYTAFFEEGPSIQYSFGSFRRGRPFPTFEQIVTARDESGIPRSFLATEAAYGAIREMQRRNLIIPVVGDFAGDRALRSVASFLGERGLRVSVFYTSNVEQYLFRGNAARDFYGNLARFPIGPESVLVRSIFTRYMLEPPPGSQTGPGGLGSWPPWRRGTLHLDPIDALTSAAARGEIVSYVDVMMRSR